MIDYSMDATTTLKAIPILGRFINYVVKRYKEPMVEVTTSRTFALYDRLSGSSYKPLDTQIRVENIGKSTVYDLRSSIYFHGSMGTGENNAKVTVDTRGTWDQQEGTNISLPGGESEWLNVLRVVQDYQSGHNFDSDTDVYLIFPTDKGWEQPSRIRIEWPDGPGETQLTRDRLDFKTAKKVIWQEARIEIIGEDKNSNRVSIVHDLDLAKVRDGMDNRAMFFRDST